MLPSPGAPSAFFTSVLKDPLVVFQFERVPEISPTQKGTLLEKFSTRAHLALFLMALSSLFPQPPPF